jgi:hypothetical protein
MRLQSKVSSATLEESPTAAPPPVATLEQSYKYDHDGLRRLTNAGYKQFGYGYDGSNLVVQNFIAAEGGYETIHYMWGPTGPVMEMGSGGNILAYSYTPGGDLVTRFRGVQLMVTPTTIPVFMALMAKNFGLMRMLCLTSRLDGMVRLATSLILAPDWYTAGIVTMIQSLVVGLLVIRLVLRAG